MRRFVLAVLLAWFSVPPATAGWNVGSGTAVHELVRIDWQYPWHLPPRFRNHCAYEDFTARSYCSNHCGGDYQFYYCSQASFGCCHFGRGYCDWGGFLRCHP